MMATHLSRCFQHRIYLIPKYAHHQFFRYESSEQQTQQSDVSYEEDEFRRLQILPVKQQEKEDKKRLASEIMGPRYKRMPVDQDWTNVWPAARSFHPATVPLPLHQGYVDPLKRRRAPPGKFANPELMKTPNFLHLTPPAIKKHCEAIKQFCTQWPKGLESDEKCDQFFPIEIISDDYFHSATSIRYPPARIVSLKVKMSRLKLDEHAKDKMIRLLNERYDPKTDMITITADRCPLKKQNYDYAHYLLTAVFFESWKTEPWEEEKTEADWEKYYWHKSKSKESIVKYMKEVFPDKNEDQILEDEKVKNYANAVCQLHDEPENEVNLNNYKQSVLQLLF